MHCTICKVGNTQPGTKTLTFEQGENIIILKHVRGEVCETCGHLYSDSETSRRILEVVEQRFASGTELVVVRI